MSKKVCVVLVGGPCSGKSSTGKIAAEILDAVYISSGDIARNMAQDSAIIKNDLMLGRLAPEDNMRNAISSRLWLYFKRMDRDIVILDGFPRFGDQAKWLHEELPRNIDVRYVEIYAPLLTIIERSNIRNRDDDKNLEARLIYYYGVTHKELNDRIEYLIDTSKASVQECAETLVKYIKEATKQC